MSIPVITLRPSRPAPARSSIRTDRVVFFRAHRAHPILYKWSGVRAILRVCLPPVRETRAPRDAIRRVMGILLFLRPPGAQLAGRSR